MVLSALLDKSEGAFAADMVAEVKQRRATQSQSLEQNCYLYVLMSLVVKHAKYHPQGSKGEYMISAIDFLL